LWRKCGVLQQRVGHHRQGVDRRALLSFNQVKRFARIKAPLQYQGSAVRQGGRQGIDSAVGPKQRNGNQHAIAG
jgi:hypothetical protein